MCSGITLFTGTEVRVYVIIACHEMFFGFFLQAFEKVKAISLQVVPTVTAGQIWPTVVICNPFSLHSLENTFLGWNVLGKSDGWSQ